MLCTNLELSAQSDTSSQHSQRSKRHHVDHCCRSNQVLKQVFRPVYRKKLESIISTRNERSGRDEE